MEKTAITWDSRASHCHRIVYTIYFFAWDKSPTSLVLIIGCSHLRLHSFYPEEEIQNVAYPHNGYADSSHRHIFHADKSDDHNYGHHADDLAFGSKRHGSFLHKTVQMFFVKVCSYKPGMEPFRAFCEAEQRCHIKGNRRQDRKDNSDGAKSKAKKPQQDPEYSQWISHFLFLSHMRFRQLKRIYVHLLLLLSDQCHKVHECFPP